MLIGALGDIHGEFDTVRQIMARHADVQLWLQVGDIATNDGEYFSPPAAVYFIKGNNEDFDVIMTHEAPRPFYPAGKRIDAGKTAVNDVLTAMRPRLHLFGHHHEFTDSQRHGIRSIGLDIVTKSYLLIHAETFRCERLDT